MKRNAIPGISRIDFLLCSDLPPGLMLQSMGGITVAVAAPSQRIHFRGKATLTWEGSLLNGVRIEKSTLEFKSSERLPERTRLAFVVTGADGRQLLIGSRESRFPVISYSDTMGESGSSPNLRTYKITHTAQKSVLECVL